MRKFLLIIFFFILTYNVFPTHCMGGEITWVCIHPCPNYGQYTFTLKIYQDCDGISFTYFDEFLTVIITQ